MYSRLGLPRVTVMLLQELKDCTAGAAEVRDWNVTGNMPVRRARPVARVLYDKHCCRAMKTVPHVRVVGQQHRRRYMAVNGSRCRYLDYVRALHLKHWY